MSVKLSIVIPTQGLEKKLTPCLSSLFRQSYPQDELEVIVCLNSPVASAEEFLRQQKNIILCHADNLNEARNVGLLKARGEIIFLLDDDCELADPNYLTRLVNLFSQNTALNGVGGVYQAPASANVYERVYNKNSKKWIESSVYDGQHALFLLGGNFAVRKKLVEQGCAFDEGIDWGGSELSFFIEAAKRNFPLEYRQDLVVLHHCRLSFSSLIRKIRKQSARTKLYIQRGLLPRQNIQVQPETEGFSEMLVVKVINFVFMPDKFSLFFLVLFLPFRLIPREPLNQFYNSLIGYLTLFDRKRR